MIKIICFLLLIAVLPAAAGAAQLGRITREVNFRKGPDRSTPVIGRLAAGAEVEVIKLDPSGWYFITHRGRPGFVHKNYIALDQYQNSDQQSGRQRRQLAISGGIILAGIGIILTASAFVPDLLVTAAVLIVALISVVILDLLFRLGVLYSLFYVSFGVFGLFLFFKIKKKNRNTPTDKIPVRKAA